MFKKLLAIFRKALIDDFPYPDQCFDCNKMSCKDCKSSFARQGLQAQKSGFYTEALGCVDHQVSQMPAAANDENRRASSS